MGKPDVYESDYLDDNRRFADMINVGLFGGEQIVLSQDLEDADKELNYIGNKEVKKLICDKVRRWKKNGIIFAVLSVENQNYVDYAMVLRTMLTEAMAYHKQWKRKKRKHDQAKDLKSKDEFLSGITEYEKFTPIIPLVVYYEIEKPWSGPRTLYELLDIQGKDELKPFINNYKLNLYDFHERDGFGEFQTELRTLFEFLRYSDNEDELDKIIGNDLDRYENTDYETAELISVLAGIDINKKLKVSEENGIMTGKEAERRMINMCKAWDDHKESGRREGQKVVVLNMLKRGMEDADIIDLVECDKTFVDEMRSLLQCAVGEV